MASESPDASSSDEASTNQSASSKTDGHADSTSDSSFNLAKAETQAVRRSKILVLCVILTAAAAVGATIYVLLSKEEHNRFVAEFSNHGQEIIELVNYKAQSVFTAIDTLSVMVTSLSIDKNITWPDVVVPHFELRAGEINHLANSDQVTFVPLVKQDMRRNWEEFSVEHQDWLAESLQWQDLLATDNKTNIYLRRRAVETSSQQIPTKIWQYSKDGAHTLAEGPNAKYGAYAPVWQQAPAPKDPSIINYDLLSHPVFERIYHGMWDTQLPVISEILDLGFLTASAVQDTSKDPRSFLMTPVYPFFRVEQQEREELAGFFVSVLSWKHYFQNLLVDGTNGITVVLHNSCGDYFTYELNGGTAVFKGNGALHEERFSDLSVQAPFAPFLKHNFPQSADHCEYDLRIFPSTTVEDAYLTNRPALYTSVVVLVFVFTAMVFVVYDFMVQRRQDKVMATAKRTNAIVSSLFPSNVRDRIMQDVEEQADQEIKEKKVGAFGGGFGKGKFKDLDEGETNGPLTKFDSRPIADLYPEVTVMFADIVGFTAWSSVREPTQVFTLLETLFAAFDAIADQRRVFKVETVGDCYVAVCGLPEARKDHALVMARFARDVLYKMNDLTKTMEVILGPDTGDLSLRVGLHSGQVTAGVLRGDKSRFQLFGDTMNTCSRIESTGERNKIHLSSETATLLVTAGKGHWVQERTEVITAKGKGYLQTYWLNLRPQSAPSTRSGSSGDESEVRDDPHPNPVVEKLVKSTGAVERNAEAEAMAAAKTSRLIDWNVDVLTRVLKQIQMRRMCLGNETKTFAEPEDTYEGTILDEVKEIITLPRFDKSLSGAKDQAPEELDPKVVEQLRSYVTMIASLYRDNPFHSFEHASHVTMSVVKLLSRIVAPDDKIDKGKADEDNVASILHDHTYGITSDPLTQFACIFSALIHDVDHQGVPNTQLLKENAAIATVYGGRSIAEQNSVDIAWGLLMDHQFKDLRSAIYCDASEAQRFRQLVVNAVMATDIMDKEAGMFRKQRWEKAFSEHSKSTDSDLDAVNRKATIVIEHLIQASDVAHTMQHWHIYSKWNERLFEEMYRAYQDGRADKNPSESWYEGEIGFFDYYIIPLAKKLKACGVFGVSSDEYLNYALGNRKEWEARGKERVELMVAKYGGGATEQVQ